MGKQTLTTFMLIGLSLLGAFLLDVLFLPDVPTPLVYVIPILIAVYFASPRTTAAVAVVAVVTNVVTDNLLHIPFPIWSRYTFVFMIIVSAIVYLSYRLSAQKRENGRLYEESEYQRARWEATVESMIDPVTLGDAAGHATYMNSVYARNLGRQINSGVSLEEQPAYYGLYRNDGTLFDPQDLPLRKAALSGQEVSGIEILQRPADGHEFVAIWNASPIRDSRCRVIGAVAVGRDVTESKKAEKALRESEESYRTLLQSIPQKVFYKDKDSVYLAVNASYAQDFHLSPADFVGKSDFDFYQPDLAEKYRRDDRRVLLTGIPEEFDESYVSAGEMRTVHTLKAPVRDDEGKVKGVLGIFWDITERKRAEEERERLLGQVQQFAALSQRRAAELQGILDHMVDAVLVANPDGQLKLVNQPGLKLIGAKEPSDLKRGIAEIAELIKLRHPNGESILPEETALARALKGEVVVNFDQVAVDLNTKCDVYLRATAAPIKDEGGEIVGAVAVIRDVTELTELDRLKGQFVDVAAHELKTPVTIMKGTAQLILRSMVELTLPQRKLLEGMIRNADRIDRIVNDLLNISQLQGGQIELVKERFDLSELVEETIGRMALTTTKHEIQLLHAEPVVITADRGRLEQVLINLIDNAVRYSPAGVNIELTMHVENGEVTVSVRDFGVGIPKHKQDRIFQRFYRAHTGTPYDYGGMGVGLYITREIVARHGGRTWFESEEGKGSTFSFSIPLPGAGG